MGTYELSGYKNGKPYWLSLTALIGFNNFWTMADLHRGVYDSLIYSAVKSERPTESKNNWFEMLGQPISVGNDISVKCTGILNPNIVCKLNKIMFFENYFVFPNLPFR